MSFVLKSLILRLLVFAIPVLLMYKGCSDEFSLAEREIELIGENKEIALVYANICPQNDIHLIRINRGFTVNNFFDANTNPDSIYFNPSDLTVYAYKIRGEDTLKRFVCRDTIIEKDSSGNFTTDYVNLYYFKSSSLSNISNDNEFIGIEVLYDNKCLTSKTLLIKKPFFSNIYSSNYHYSFYSSATPIIFVYRKNTHAIELSANCNFYEKRNYGNRIDTVMIEFKILIGNATFQTPSSTDKYQDYSFTNDSFFRNLERSILEQGDTIHTTKRWIGKIQYVISAGNTDLVMFNRLTDGFNIGFHDELASYSNISNGLGFLISHSECKSNTLTFRAAAKDTITNRFGTKYYFE